MAITFSNFLTQVRNYTEVDSNVLTDAIIQDFIRSVELNVAGKVDYDDLRKYATSNFTSSNRYITLPADAVIVRSIQVIDGSGNRTFLEKRDTSFISEYNNDGSTGTPKYWANWDDFTALVAPTPSSALQVQINYIIDPPNFTSTNNTFLSTYQESMLLHGVLAEAFRYLKGPMDMYNLYQTEYNEEIQNFALQQMGRRRRSEYDDGVPRVQVPSPTPNT
tara:strand:+ start:250 stop:909 length:660 start_codon:yes stop_codon:yes gene_type:complete